MPHASEQRVLQPLPKFVAGRASWITSGVKGSRTSQTVGCDVDFSSRGRSKSVLHQLQKSRSRCSQQADSSKSLNMFSRGMLLSRTPSFHWAVSQVLVALCSCFRCQSANQFAGKQVEIAIAAPKALEKNEKIVTSCAAMVTAAKKVLLEALDMATQSKSQDKLQLAYETNCVVRYHMLEIWEAQSVDVIPNRKAVPSDPTAATPATPPAVASVAVAPDNAAAQERDAKKESEGQGEGEQAKANERKPEDARSNGSQGNAAARVSSSLRKALEKAGSAAQHVDPLSSLMAHAHMAELLAGFMDCSSVDDLNNAVQQLKDASAAVRQLKDGATKAASSLKSHITSRQRAEHRKKQQQTKQVESAEVQKQKKAAKTAAEEIKKQELVLPPVFHLAWGSLKSTEGDSLGTEVTICSGPKDRSINNLDEPCCIANCDALAEFMKNAKVGLSRVC